MFSDWYAKPKEYPHALVMYYWFAETDRELEENRIKVVEILINADIGRILPILKTVNLGEKIDDERMDNTQIGNALAGDLGLRIKPVRYALETY